MIEAPPTGRPRFIVSALLLLVLVLPVSATEWNAIGQGGGGSFRTFGAIHPTNPDIAMMGTDVGGVYRTGDGGLNWEANHTGIANRLVGGSELNTLNERVYGTYAVVFNPNPPYDTVYLGTGTGVFKSLDAGVTWDYASAPSGTSIRAIVIDPLDNNRVYGAGAFGDILTSTDGFATPGTLERLHCPVVGDPEFRSIVLRHTGPQNDVELLAASTCGLFHHDGSVWSHLASPSLPNEEIGTLRQGPSGDLYLTLNVTPATSVAGDSTAWLRERVFKSTDFGANWQNISGTEYPAEDPLGAFWNGASYASPWQERAGTAVGAITQGCGTPLPPSGTSEDCITITLDQSAGLITNPRVAVVEAEEYLLSLDVRVVSAGPVGGTGINGTVFARVKWYNAAGTKIAGQDVNAWSFHDINTSWHHLEQMLRAATGATTASIEFFTFDPAATVVYANPSFVRSDHLPVSYAKVNGPVFPDFRFMAVAEGPGGEDVIYVGSDKLTVSAFIEAGNFGGVWKSVDDGATWHQTFGYPGDPALSGDPAAHERTARLNHPGDTQLIAAQGDQIYFGDAFFLYHSSDAGASWEEVTADRVDPGSGHPFGYFASRGNTNNILVWSVTTDPGTVPVGEPKRIFYGDGDGALVISDDEGATWTTAGGKANQNRWLDLSPTPVSGDTATDIVVDPTDHNIIYVAVGAGVAPGFASSGGIVKGTHDPAGQGDNLWTWELLGDAALDGKVHAFLRGGGKSMVLLEPDPLGRRFLVVATNSKDSIAAGDFGGIARIDLAAASPMWDLRDSRDFVFRLTRAPAPSHRLFAAIGDATADGPAAVDTGLFISDDYGETWTQEITPDTGEISDEPILEVLALDENTVLVGTWAGNTDYQGTSGSEWTGNGGLYRGTFNASSWQWQRALVQPRVTGLAVSPFDHRDVNSKRVYAAVSSANVPQNPTGALGGIYESLDGGQTWSARLPTPGLQHLADVRLFFSAHAPGMLYATTQGGGVFEAFEAASVPATSTLSLLGNAQGGSVSLTVSGVALVVTTSAGETAAEVAAAIAAAINTDPTLAAMAIVALVSDAVVTSNGVISGISIGDPGLSLAPGPPSIPALSAWATLLLTCGLAALGVVSQRRIR